MPELKLLPIDSPEPIRSCATCTSLRGRRSYASEEERWSCFKAPIGINPIDGRKVYYLCAYERSEAGSCMLEGKNWELYEKPNREDDSPAPTSVEQSQPPKRAGKYSLDL